MNKFLFKSTAADFQKLYQLELTTQKNVLYVTHIVDKIVRLLLELKHDKDLQTTVDKYFDETSHQTDSDNIGESPDSD